MLKGICKSTEPIHILIKCDRCHEFQIEMMDEHSDILKEKRKEKTNCYLITIMFPNLSIFAVRSSVTMIVAVFSSIIVGPVRTVSEGNRSFE